MTRAKTVDEYVENAPHFADILEKLRKVLASTDLEETIKWGAPCYTLDGRNVVGLAAFKSYAGLWFHNGAHIDDPDGVLINAQEGKTKSLRQWRFTSVREVKVRAVRGYVERAIAFERSTEGAMKKAPTPEAVRIPVELEEAMDAPTASAFASLTPGRQREYAEHIGSAKREETRRRRAAQALPIILAGRGLHDKYRGE